MCVYMCVDVCVCVCMCMCMCMCVYVCVCVECSGGAVALLSEVAGDSSRGQEQDAVAATRPAGDRCALTHSLTHAYTCTHTYIQL
jgi:hypothetical protein